MRGIAARYRREHNEAMSQAWHTANLTAYAPASGKKFQRLETLLIKDKPKARKPKDWRTEFEAFSAWAAKGKS